MSLYDGAKTNGFLVVTGVKEKVGMLQISVLTPFLFAVVVDVVTELAKDCMLRELLCADDLVLMSEAIKGLRIKFIKWKEAFESNGLKVSLGKTKVMVSGGIRKDVISKSKVDPCKVCSLRTKASSVLCVHCVVRGSNVGM